MTEYYIQIFVIMRCVIKGLHCVMVVPNEHFPLPQVLTLYLIDMPFDSFANRADADQAALVRTVL